jgi:hypothetical protein
MSKQQLVPLGTRTYSFAVGSEHGPRSGCWCVTIADDDHNVVVNIKGLPSRFFHASLHEKGRSHVTLTRRGAPSQPIVKSRWDSLDPQAHGRAIEIAIPDSCLRKASDVDKSTKPQIWLPRPPPGGVVLVGIAIVDESMAKRLARAEDRIASIGHDKVVLVSRDTADADSDAAKLVELNRPKDVQAITLDSPERRAVFAVRHPFGTLVLVEYAID